MPSPRKKFNELLESLERRMLSQDSWNGVDEQYERPYNHHSRRRSSMSEEQIMSEAVDTRTGKMKMPNLSSPPKVKKGTSDERKLNHDLTQDFKRAEQDVSRVASEFEQWADYLDTVSWGLEGFTQWQMKRREELEDYGNGVMDRIVEITRHEMKRDPKRDWGAEDLINLAQDVEQEFPEHGRDRYEVTKLEVQMQNRASDLREQADTLRRRIKVAQASLKEFHAMQKKHGER